MYASFVDWSTAIAEGSIKVAAPNDPNWTRFWGSTRKIPSLVVTSKAISKLAIAAEAPAARSPITSPPFIPFNLS